MEIIEWDDTYITYMYEKISIIACKYNNITFLQEMLLNVIYLK